MKNFTKALGLFFVILALMSFASCKVANDVTNAIKTVDEFNNLPDAPLLSDDYISEFAAETAINTLRSFTFYNDGTFRDLRVLDTNGDGTYTPDGDTVFEFRGTYTGNASSNGLTEEVITLTVTGYVFQKEPGVQKLVKPTDKLWTSLKLGNPYDGYAFSIKQEDSKPVFHCADFSLPFLG